MNFLVDTNLRLKAQVRSFQDIHNVFVKYLCGIITFLLCSRTSVPFSTLDLASPYVSFWMWVSQNIQFVKLGLIRSSMLINIDLAIPFSRDITETDNNMVPTDVLDEEIYEAVKQLNPLKAPMPYDI